MLTMILLGYTVFGLLLMDYMCPGWHPLEKVVGALIWPISAGIGLRVVLRQRAPGPSNDLVELQVAMIVSAALETHKFIKK